MDMEEEEIKLKQKEELLLLEEGEHYYFHVLAVDDSLIDRKLLEKLLTSTTLSSSSNYHVTCVESGDKALEYLGLVDNKDEDNSTTCSSFSSPQQEVQGSKVNLIMTDYSMPGMNGYDLLKRVKGSSSWKDVPVVVMSSEDVPSRINMCLEGGAEEFLLKPVKLSDLRKLQSHLVNSFSHSCENTNANIFVENGNTKEDGGRDDNNNNNNNNTTAISQRVPPSSHQNVAAAGI